MSDPLPRVPLIPRVSAPFYQVWMSALTNPNEKNFREMATSPDARARTAYVWIFIAVLIDLFFLLLVQGIVRGQFSRPQGPSGIIPIPGLDVPLIALICGIPFAALFAVLFFAVFVALVHWIAERFGGQGTYDQMAYTIGAIFAPFFLISAVLVLPSLLPYVGLCAGMMIGLLGLYVIGLEIMATRAINRLDWGPSAGSVLIPSALMLGVPFCLAFCGIYGFLFWVSTGQA